MKYISIDIETAGLNRSCSLLEFGAVADDLLCQKPLEELPRFHAYIVNDLILGEPYALAMHHKILSRISNRELPYSYIPLQNLARDFWHFLVMNGYHPGNDNKIKITVAGKNFGFFDRDWLEKELSSHITFHHRSLDPAMLYLQPGDLGPLSSRECMERAGLLGEVAHTAVEDALMVVKLLRNKLQR